MKKIYGGEYFQRPSYLNNSLLYQVVPSHTPTYAHVYTHTPLGREVLRLSLILPEYQNPYKSHLSFPQFLS